MSRGELVEIGGGFRVPEIMAESGCRLVEVGHHEPDAPGRLRARSCAPTRRCVLKVHASNYRMIGFTEATPVARARDARAAGDGRRGFGSARRHHAVARRTVPRGCTTSPACARRSTTAPALVTFSGDKLLGGPQAGVIVGRADVVARVAGHPLARAMRADKMTLAALQHVALTYLSGDATSIPLWRMATVPVEELRARAEAVAARASGHAKVVDTEAVAGGGSLPGLTIPSVGVAVESGDPTGALARLRDAGVVARIVDDAVVCDLRTVDPADDAQLASALLSATVGLSRLVAKPNVAGTDVRVVATAGHVDHGKSSLVLALTGTDPDRFPEEKARGLDHRPRLRVHDAAVGRRGRLRRRARSRPLHQEHARRGRRGRGRAARRRRERGLDAPERGAPAHPRAARRPPRAGRDHEGRHRRRRDARARAARRRRAPRGHGARRRADRRVRLGVRARARRRARRRSTPCSPQTPTARDDGRPRLWVDRVFAAKGAGTVVTGTLTGGTHRGRRRRRGRESAPCAPGCGRSRPRTARSTAPAREPASRSTSSASSTASSRVATPSSAADQWTFARVVDVAVTVVPGEDLERRGRLQAYVGSGEHGVWSRVLDDGNDFARLRLATRHCRWRPATGSCCATPGASAPSRAPRCSTSNRRRRRSDAPAVLALPLGERLLAGAPVAPRRADLAAPGRALSRRGPGPCRRPASRAAAPSRSTAGWSRRRSLAVAPVGRVANAYWRITLTIPSSGARAGRARLVAARRPAPGSAPLLRRRARPGRRTGCGASRLARRRRGRVPEARRAARRARRVTVLAARTGRRRRHARARADADARRPAHRSRRRGVLDQRARCSARDLVVDALRERRSLTVADVRDVLGSTRKFVVPDRDVARPHGCHPPSRRRPRPRPAGRDSAAEAACSRWLEQAAPLVLVQATPDPVRVADAERVVEARGPDPAAAADRLGPGFAGVARALGLGHRRREEQRRLRSSARGVALPGLLDSPYAAHPAPPPGCSVGRNLPPRTGRAQGPVSPVDRSGPSGSGLAPPGGPPRRRRRVPNRCQRCGAGHAPGSRGRRRPRARPRAPGPRPPRPARSRRVRSGSPGWSGPASGRRG